jgi:hypothetical protein
VPLTCKCFYHVYSHQWIGLTQNEKVTSLQWPLRNLQILPPSSQMGVYGSIVSPAHWKWERYLYRYFFTVALPHLQVFPPSSQMGIYLIVSCAQGLQSFFWFKNKKRMFWCKFQTNLAKFGHTLKTISPDLDTFLVLGRLCGHFLYYFDNFFSNLGASQRC